jgi:peptidyl-prolyl cis-trans isomerase C
MSFFEKRFVVIGLTVGLTAVLCGCDLFSPPKKAKKTSSEATQQSTPSAVAQTPGPLPADAIARIGNWTLTADEFNQRLKILKQGLADFNENDAQTRKTVLEELVRQQLLVKDAEDQGIDNKKDIKDAVEDFRRTLLVQELANRITKDVVATEEDARKYYDDNKNLFVKWKVRQIVVPDEATAKNLAVQILQGSDFATVAKEQSKDKTAADGGLISDLTKISPDVQKVILTLDAGGTSNVFKGPDGYYLVHVDEKKLQPFADIKADLISGLTLQKQQAAIVAYIGKLEEKTKVEKNEQLLGGK